MRQAQRAKQIEEIGKSIFKAQLGNKEVNKKEIILAAMAELNLSQRTASEYVNVAFFKLENNNP